MNQFYKSISYLFKFNTSWAFVLLLSFFSFQVNATIYNVTVTTDGHATNQLRGAVEAADAAGGLNTINIVAGTYTLTLGTLVLTTKYKI